MAMDIAAWLQQLGLERYAQAFRDNEIEADILSTLTAEDLSDLGVTVVGHRRKLLNAIDALAARDEGSRERSATPSPSADARRGEAERRQLTVMFVDLVGSTALSAKLDPEDMREVLRAYQNAVAGEITRFEGHVAKFMGDGVLAYFGWPRAHEDEAERAIRAGLALVGAVRGLSTPAGAPLAARVGIATGLVVVGDLVGEGAAQEQAVVGETPNLAGRLQGLARPGQVVIAEATRWLVGSGFDLDDLGLQVLKGISEPAHAFAILGERALESRFEARSGPSLLPMVGRDQELALLLERWVQARAGEGQGVLLVGEAGIGKSRISRALLDAVADEPHIPIRYQCSPYHSDSTLWPVIQHLTHAAGLVASDPSDARLDKLEALLAQAGDAAEAAPLIADLIGLDGAARYGELNLTPQAQRARTLESLVDQLLGLAARQPVLVVLEDAHWIDPTTLELTEQGLDRIADARALILLTSRPDQQPELAGHPHVTRLTLNRLGRGGVEAIVARLAAGRTLSGDVVDAIITRTDGVPLFVEELTKAVLETGETTIPASLHDSLMTRLDRIPEVKEIAQTAACIGRAFDYALLAAIADKSEPALATALDKLTAAELVFRRGVPPHAIYTFKHALVQDAAYHSLLKSKRQQLHARIAEALEERFPDVGETQPEVLAQHLTEAGLTEEAIDYWRKAGNRAVERSANTEAIAHFTRGLTLLAALPDSPNRMRREIAMQTALGAPLLAKKGFGAAEVGEAYSRAIELCEQADEISLLSPALQGLSSYYIVRAELQLAREMAERCLALAQHFDDRALFLGGHHLLGAILGLMGEPDAACDHLHQALAIYDPRAHRAIAFRYGADMGVFDRSLCAHFLWQIGYVDQALETAEVALALANEVSHPFSQAMALSFAAMLHQFRRETQAARQTAAAAAALCDERGFSYYGAWSTLIYGETLVEDRQAEEGIAQMRSGLEAMRATGARLRHPYYLSLLAQAYRKVGKVEEAKAHLAEALALVEASSERWWQAELHRIQGELLLTRMGNGQTQACSCFERALEISRQQRARSLELRAATSLAHLWAEQGERQKASDLLVPVYGWFTEGFDTADLKDAKALLDALR
jgi:predicted ATPase/class 3 adenylate cyclase